MRCARQPTGHSVGTAHARAASSRGRPGQKAWQAALLARIEAVRQETLLLLSSGYLAGAGAACGDVAGACFFIASFTLPFTSATTWSMGKLAGNWLGG